VTVSSDTQAWHTLSTDLVLRAEEVAGPDGLSSAEAASRAERFGPNKFATGKTEPRWRAFLRQYADPMQVVLLVAGVGSLYPLKELGTGLLLLALTVFNATIVKAVNLGRGLYDNLTKYIRFQMGSLFGFIVSFLGAAIFNIAGGVPFLPLQTLWINFTTLLFQGLGLGYGEPASGLMDRKPRQPERPILTRGVMTWLVAAGLVMGAGTLGVASWAEQTHTAAIAHTMGVVTFSLATLFFSMTTRDERRTVFSLDTFSDRTFNIATIASVLTLILATVLGPLQSLLETTSLDVQQWLICICAGLAIVVVSEVRKAIRRRRMPTDSLTGEA
jgi:magnesium-transporting ATPase (P-type)